MGFLWFVSLAGKMKKKKKMVVVQEAHGTERKCGPAPEIQRND